MTLSSINLGLLSFFSLLVCEVAIADTITENGLTYELDGAHTTAKLINVDSSKTSVNVPQYLELSSYYLVNEITEDAFANCTKLTELTLSFADPDWSTITIPQKTFANCPLEKVMLGRILNLSEYASPFYSKESIKEIEIGLANTDVTWRLFGNCKSVETIIIQNGVENIESDAFKGFTSLLSISLPLSLIRIGNSAFENCSALTTLTIPKDIASIGQKAFYDCNSLKDIYYLSDVLVNIDKNTFSNEVYSSTRLHVPGSAFGKISYPWDNFSNIKYEDGVSVITHNNLTYRLNSTNNTASLIGANTEITSVVIPANITGSDGKTSYSVNTVSGNPFKNCKNLSDITIEDSRDELCFDNSDFTNCTLSTIYVGRNITYIKGMYGTPFFHQKNIRQLTLSECITSISDNLFRACGGFESVVIPSLVTYIGKYAFGGCTTLKNIKLPEGLSEISDQAFNGCSTLETIELPKSLQFIGKSVFWNCTSLTNIEIPKSVTMISDDMFQNCTSLKSVKMPGVKTIGARAFIDCTSLTELNLPDGLSSIQERAFSGCSNLKSITFPNQLDSIGNKAFAACKALTSLYIPASVKTIGYTAFEGTSINTLTIEDSENSLELMYGPGGLSVSALEGMFNPCPLKRVYIGRNLKYTDIMGVDINNQSCTSPFFYNREIEEVTFGNNVTIIPDQLFWASESLKKVTIAPSVRSFGNQAFDYCVSLENIDIPNSVISLGASVFSSCTALKELIIPESVTSIGEYAFSGCSSLTSINIPKSVKKLEHFSFINCPNVESVYCCIKDPDIFKGTIDNKSNITLYVPKGTKEKYENNSSWGGFKEYIERQYIDELSFGKDVIKIGNGKSRKLSVTVSPTDADIKDIVWRSNNEGIVTVADDGTITAHALGEAVLTAKTTDMSGVSQSITVKVMEYDLGDSNKSGETNIADAVNVANYAVGNTNDIDKEYADVNDDGKVTISDAYGIVTLVLAQPANLTASRSVSRCDIEASGSDCLLVGDYINGYDNTGKVEVSLDNHIGYVAIQADIFVPEGVTIRSIEAGGRAVNHTLMSHEVGGNAYRVVLFNLNNREFTETGEPLFSINCDMDGQISEEIIIDNIIASDSRSNEYKLVAKKGNDKAESGLINIEGSHVSVSGENGSIRILGAAGSNVAVYSVEGKAMRSGVVDSDIETIPVAAGMYIVAVGNTVERVLVK